MPYIVLCLCIVAMAISVVARPWSLVLQSTVQDRHRRDSQAETNADNIGADFVTCGQHRLVDISCNSSQPMFSILLRSCNATQELEIYPHKHAMYHVVDNGGQLRLAEPVQLVGEASRVICRWSDHSGQRTRTLRVKGVDNMCVTVPEPCPSVTPSSPPPGSTSAAGVNSAAASGTVLTTNGLTLGMGSPTQSPTTNIVVTVSVLTGVIACGIAAALVLKVRKVISEAHNRRQEERRRARISNDSPEPAHHHAEPSPCLPEPIEETEIFCQLTRMQRGQDANACLDQEAAHGNCVSKEGREVPRIVQPVQATADSISSHSQDGSSRVHDPRTCRRGSSGSSTLRAIIAVETRCRSMASGSNDSSEKLDLLDNEEAQTICHASTSGVHPFPFQLSDPNINRSRSDLPHHAQLPSDPRGRGRASVRRHSSAPETVNYRVPI